MVDSEQGITNLQRAKDVIVDASYAKQWFVTLVKCGGRDGKHMTLKSRYSRQHLRSIYQETINFWLKPMAAFQTHHYGYGSKRGLNAQKAEEYGSHDKTFWNCSRRHDAYCCMLNANIVCQTRCWKGDIWRACQTKIGSNPEIGFWKLRRYSCPPVWYTCCFFGGWKNSSSR